MEVTPKADRSKNPHSTPCDSEESSPYQTKDGKLSSSLKERLRRSRRSFTSPISVAKRLCVDQELDGQQVSAGSTDTVNNPPVISHSVHVNRNEAQSGCESFPGGVFDSPDFVQQRVRLRRAVRDKTEKLRRLKMVKMYRSKNDLTQLQTLIDKWRSCAQAALNELQTALPVDGRKASLSELIDLFGLDDGILHYDRTEEDFTT
ncbi:swi5-dependent recombination DNA repair protein 1 homolog isoform X2 [Thalassophryne amazonica]|uniref:swi5-dependent recombination DNA repair protein 1 homolog isoform X2 n=1 Tax=Thalassophryne amazonica TaxID=390379 RepID=UPI001470E542|nr:swi5-dependent recombination DNA repair protein 1 homolog isoform X2 [Thalassophryne amazonica]